MLSATAGGWKGVRQPRARGRNEGNAVKILWAWAWAPLLLLLLLPLLLLLLSLLVLVLVLVLLLVLVLVLVLLLLPQWRRKLRQWPSSPPSTGTVMPAPLGGSATRARCSALPSPSPSLGLQQSRAMAASLRP